MRKFFWILGFLSAFLFFGGFVVLIVLNIKEPKLLDAWSWFFIFGSFTIAIGAFAAFLKIVFLKLFFREPLQIFHFKNALRQGLLFGVLLSVMLFLQANQQLTFFTGALVIFAIILFEFLLSRKNI